MALNLTCKACGTELVADTEEELAAMGQLHGAEHGHVKPMAHNHVLARIRRHNPKSP